MRRTAKTARRHGDAPSILRVEVQSLRGGWDLPDIVNATLLKIEGMNIKDGGMRGVEYIDGNYIAWEYR